MATINVQPGATVTLTPPEGSDNPFMLNGSQLLAAMVFDAEVTMARSLQCDSGKSVENPPAY